MMAHYALSMADGSIAIMETFGKTTVEQALAKWTKPERDKIVSHIEVDQAIIPSDRTFRNAWKLNGDAVEIDMDRAREIHQARIEKAAERQKVNAPAVDLSKAATPDDLKVVWPEGIKRPVRYRS